MSEALLCPGQLFCRLLSPLSSRNRWLSVEGRWDGCWLMPFRLPRAISGCSRSGNTTSTTYRHCQQIELRSQLSSLSLSLLAPFSMSLTQLPAVGSRQSFVGTELNKLPLVLFATHYSSAGQPSECRQARIQTDHLFIFSRPIWGR